MTLPRTAVALAVIIGSLGGAPASAEDLAIYNWADYFGPDTISRYEEETGTNVILDYFDSNEVLETKLLTGSSGYDIVFPATSNAEREFQAGALLPIDPSRLSNYANLNPNILQALDNIPGGRQMGVPYTWGTIGIAYNAAMIKERLGDRPMDTWDVLFDPEVADKLADCGIAVLDSPIEMVAVTLNSFGTDPYSDDEADLEKVKALWKEAADSIRYFHNQKPSTDLPSGDVCMAIMYSGDAGIAQARALEADNGVEIVYSIPKEGTLMWIDLMAIPADSENLDEAYRFIDYMLQPDVIADVTNTVFFANANEAAGAHIDPSILSDPGIYPDQDTLKRLFPDKSVNGRTLRNRTRLWTSIKSGI